MLYRERPQKTPLSDELRGLTTAQCMERADRVMNDLVSSREDAADVYLCRYFYRQQYDPGSDTAAAIADPAAVIYDADLRMALERDPKDVRVRLAVADHVRRLARAAAAVPGSRSKRDEYVQEAVRQYEQILQTEPDNEAAFLQLGNMYFEQGDVDNALKTWKRGVASRRMRAV